jgi:hypothetical protein
MPQNCHTRYRTGSVPVWNKEPSGWVSLLASLAPVMAAQRLLNLGKSL